MKDGKRDYLKVDPPIPGQDWVCLSFVSPEALIKQREMEFFNQFLYHEVNKTLKAQATHMVKELAHVLRKTVEPQVDKYKASVNENERLVGKHLEEAYKKLIPDEEEFANRCMHLYAEDYDELHDKYKIFKLQNAVELDKKFDAEHDNLCSVRGLKVRGVFNDRRDADNKAKELRKLVEPVHVFVAPVGYWLPWDPDPDAIQDSEYMMPQLNELMKKYHDNVRDKNRHFEERKRDEMQNANLSNAERRKKAMLKKLADRRQQKITMEMQKRQRELKASEKRAALLAAMTPEEREAFEAKENALEAQERQKQSQQKQKKKNNAKGSRRR